MNRIQPQLVIRSQIVQIFQSNLKPIKNTTKCIRYYDYCNSNVDKFVEMLEEDLKSCSIDDFGTFYQKFNTVLATTCKLDVPKCFKHTMQNNPWITGGLFVLNTHCHDLNKAWVKATKLYIIPGSSSNSDLSTSI